jgi:hypothetical protein
VLSEFFQQDGGLWRQKRCDEEIVAYQHQASTNKRIARERTDRRNGNESSTNRSPVTVESREPNQNHKPEPEPENTKPLASPDKSGSAGPVNGSAVAYIPLNDGSEFGVSKEFLAELEQAYPRVDGAQTLKEIRVWCIANPANRKTRKGAARFINRWFERVQNDGR